METVADVGEFALIGRIAAALPPPGGPVVLGCGDDAAVVRLSGDAAVSTDTMVEGVHFKRAWSSAVDVGHKAVASAAADLEAMGATPVAVVVALTVPPDESAQWVEQLRDGMAQECSRAGLALVGGDLTGGATVVVTCTVVGDLAGRPPVKRSGAAHGNVVAQIGPLGMAQAGLAVLSRGFRSPAAAVEAHRRPQPPYGQGAVAAAAGATAMIDVSDGLVADLRHVAESSGVQLQLKSALLPVNDTLRAVAGALGGLDPAGFALDGGDDHALVATFRPEDVPEGWRIIGQVVDAAEHTVLVDERPWTGCGGWEHFASGRPRD